MFSGLVSTTGNLRKVDRLAKTIKLTIAPTTKSFSDQLKIGDSVAVNGTCLTVTSLSGATFTVTLMPQTFDKTTFKNQAEGALVNLERSVKVDQRLEGYLVSGHVDETTIVKTVSQNENAIEVCFEMPSRLAGQIIPQGSIAINGVSVTVMDTGNNWFSVGLIPHTQAVTNLDQLAVGDEVNLETDMIGKYVVANLQKGVRN